MSEKIDLSPTHRPAASTELLAVLTVSKLKLIAHFREVPRHRIVIVWAFSAPLPHHIRVHSVLSECCAWRLREDMGTVEFPAM